MEKKAGKKEGAKESELQDYKETLQRLQAEFENYRKRVEKEREAFAKYCNASLIRDLLPVIDSIESCIGKCRGEEEREGIALIRKQLMDILGAKGLGEINAAGGKFNPEFHEVIAHGSDPASEEGIVLEQFQKGYVLNGRVLRPAKVKINKLDEEGKNKI